MRVPSDAAVRTLDNQSRMRLPPSWANCLILMEEVSDVEIRITKVRICPIPPKEQKEEEKKE
jgi:hypothetical protein